MIVWANEDQLWQYMVPRLRGYWRRLEAAQPDGMPDSFGLFRKHTIWLEHKVGFPNKTLLRPKQIEFGLECMRRSIPYFVAFGHRGDVLIYGDYSFKRRVWPDWWVRPGSTYPADYGQ